MASKTSSSLALSLTLNLLLFVIANACGTCTGPIPRPPKSGPSPNLPRPGPGQNSPRPGPSPNVPRPGPSPNNPQPGPSPNTPQPGPSPNTPQPGPSPNTPQPGPSPPGGGGGGGGGGGNCPRDALKLGVCADVLGLINVSIGAPPRLPCCSLLGNLVNLEAAVCLCTAIRANVLGINLNVPVTLSLVLNYCGVGVPPGFQCA